MTWGIFKKILHPLFVLMLFILTSCSGGLRGISLSSIEDSQPMITQSMMPYPSGSYRTSVSIPIVVGFSKNVLVSGLPYLELSTSPPAKAYFTSGSGTNGLLFTYTVSNGESSIKLDYISESALKLNGGSITSEGGTPAILTLPIPDLGNSLTGSGGNEKVIVIDTTAPSPATSISWTVNSPSTNPNMVATWVQSASSDYAYSRINLYPNGNCSGSTYAQSFILNAATPSNWTFSGSDLQTYSFEVISYDFAGNSSKSSCSSGLSLNTTPPLAATGLNWLESSPYYLNDNITARWNVSTSTDVANQKIQLYKFAGCNIVHGAEIDLNSSNANSYVLSVGRGMEYSFKVKTIDVMGMSTMSACSPAMIMPNWVAGTRGALAAGRYHSCALMSDGVYCWGNNSNGQIGNGTQ